MNEKLIQSENKKVNNITKINTFDSKDIQEIKENLNFEKKIILAKSFYQRMNVDKYHIKIIQNKLLEKGEKLEKYGADGDLGEETFNAIINFQIKNGLNHDGKVGTNTLKILGIDKTTLEFYSSKDNKINNENIKQKRNNNDINEKEIKLTKLEQKRIDNFRNKAEGFKKDFKKLDLNAIFKGEKQISKEEARYIISKLVEISNQLNRVLKYKSDTNTIEKLKEENKINKEQLSRGNYSMTPFEAITNYTGDCEEFAAIKYHFLKYIGIPEEYLFLSRGDKKVNNKKIAHMNLFIDFGFIKKDIGIYLDIKTERGFYFKGTTKQKNTFSETYKMNKSGVIMNGKRVANNIKTYSPLLNDKNLFT